MIELALRRTHFNGKPSTNANDFVVIWKSRAFGLRTVGRIMRNTEQESWSRQQVWTWSLTTAVGNGVNYGYGQASSLDEPKRRFRIAFERKELETPYRRGRAPTNAARRESSGCHHGRRAGPTMRVGRFSR